MQLFNTAYDEPVVPLTRNHVYLKKKDMCLMSIRAKYFAIDNPCWRVKRERDGCESVTRQTSYL